MKNGLKKEDSLLIYGIAILFMIYHHLFSIPEKLGNADYFSILNTLLGEMTEQRLAWLFRLCVPFYSFISGYGICKIISQEAPIMRCSHLSLLQNYIFSIKQILKLMKKYWIVFFTFIPIGVFLLNKPLIGPKTFIRSLLGFCNEYNAEWWYIKQYVLMVLLFPLFDFILCNLVTMVSKNIINKFKYGKHFTITAIFLFGILLLLFRNISLFGRLISQLDNGTFVFTLVFFVGYICSFFRIFEFGKDNAIYQRIRPFLAIILLFACFGIRWIRAYDALYCKYDAFITAPIIYSLVTLFTYIKFPTNIIRTIGKYSTYMWLTHTFFCYYYFNQWIIKCRISILMFLLTTLLSLGCAIILTHIENIINKLTQRKIST